jgi:hypothetical protein
MALMMVIGNASALGGGIWATRLTPAEVRRLGAGTTASGRRSVIGIHDPIVQNDRGQVTFEPGTAIIFNAGTSDEAILIDLGCSTVTAPPIVSTSNAHGSSQKMNVGDTEFLSEVQRLLGPQSAEVAREFLIKIRENRPGDLQKGKKWINYPDNFLAIVIQPRKKKMIIYLRGKPSEYDGRSINLEPDWGYTRFILDSVHQVDDAVRIVLDSTTHHRPRRRRVRRGV